MTSVAIIAAFHITGAVYDSRNRWWLFRTPRHQADSTSSPAPGKQDPNELDGQLALLAGETWRDGGDQQRRREDADQHEDGDDEREQRADGARDAVGLLPLAARDERGIDGDERRGQRAFAEQVLQEVGDAERRVEGVGGVGLEAEVMREDLESDETGKTTEEDARGDEHRAATGSRVRGFAGSRVRGFAGSRVQRFNGSASSNATVSRGAHRIRASTSRTSSH